MTLVEHVKARYAVLRDAFQSVGNDTAVSTLQIAERALDDAVAELAPNPTDRLTLAQAEAYSGYSRGYLARLIRTERLRNVGRPRKPRVLRSDLPRKGVHP